MISSKHWQKSISGWPVRNGIGKLFKRFNKDLNNLNFTKNQLFQAFSNFCFSLEAVSVLVDIQIWQF